MPKPLGTPEKRFLHSRGLESVSSLRTWQPINQLGFVTMEKKRKIEGESLTSAPLWASPFKQSIYLTLNWLLCSYVTILLRKTYSMKPILSWFHSNHPLATSPSHSDEQNSDLNDQLLILWDYSFGELISWWGLLNCTYETSEWNELTDCTHRA